MSLQEQIEQLAKQAREAASVAAQLSTEQKNQLLLAMATALEAQSEHIQAENQKDISASADKLTKAAIDRLTLTPQRIMDMSAGLKEVAALEDPVGTIIKNSTRPNGLKVKKVRIPLGVIGMIYESRPNVTVDAAGLCLKSGNAIILRGGSEAIHSNTCLGNILRAVCTAHDVNPDIIQVVPTTDREAMSILVTQTQYIDLMIPRGGESLMKWMAENSKIPVIKHDKGLCHVFVDEDADLEMAANIAVNAKAQRPGVCNALETLLVHEKIAEQFIPLITGRYQQAGVTVRGDALTQKLGSQVEAASDTDWDEEYLDLIIAIRVVPHINAALEHIRQHGSLHTETIVTNNEKTAQYFLQAADASAVMWNASTRFNDGGQLGLGAEIGISTTKTHAFGPMGLEELTTSKYIVEGTGQIRE